MPHIGKRKGQIQADSQESKMPLTALPKNEPESHPEDRVRVSNLEKKDFLKLARD